MDVFAFRALINIVTLLFLGPLWMFGIYSNLTGAQSMFISGSTTTERFSSFIVTPQKTNDAAIPSSTNVEEVYSATEKNQINTEAREQHPVTTISSGTDDFRSSTSVPNVKNEPFASTAEVKNEPFSSTSTVKNEPVLSTSAPDVKNEPSSSSGCAQSTITSTTTTAADTQLDSFPVSGLLGGQVMPQLAIYQEMYGDFEKLKKFLPEPYAAGVERLTSQFTNFQSLTQCKLDILQALNGALSKETWALQLFDSWGKPGPSLLKGRISNVGNYHQCRDVRAPPMTGRGEGYRGNYCAVHFNPWMNITSRVPTLIPGLLSVGTCMPDTCSEKEITDLVQTALEAFGLDINLTTTTTDCRSDKREVTGATILAIIFLSIIGLLLVAGTACDVIFIQWPKWMASRDQKEGTEENLGRLHATQDDHHLGINGKDSVNKPDCVWRPSLESVVGGGIHERHNEHKAIGSFMSNEKHPLLGRGDYDEIWSSIPGKVVLSFSLYTNGSKILNTVQSSDSLTAIHGLRAVTMAWIVMTHLYALPFYLFGNLSEVVTDTFHMHTYDVIYNGFLGVDTFFVISGVLTAHGIYTKMMEKGWQLSWGYLLFHRFWRLTPPYMLVLVTILGLQRFMGSGPLWATEQPMDKEYCEKYWWANLLYINNHVKVYHMCMVQSWFLSTDMQLYLLSPLVLIALYFKVYAGLGLCLTFCLVDWVTSGVMSAEQEWPANQLSFTVHDRMDDVRKFIKHHYYSFYCRLGPYVTGLLAGYWLAVSKRKITMPWFVAVIGWIVTMTTMNLVLYGAHADLEEDPLDTSVAALYNALSRTAWGICICWVIIACATGYGGPVDKLLSWSPFVVLSRLTYMTYLVHVSIIFIYFGNMDQHFHWNETNMPILFLGILAITEIVSLVMCLAFESPMCAIENIWLNSK